MAFQLVVLLTIGALVACDPPPAGLPTSTPTAYPTVAFSTLTPSPSPTIPSTLTPTQVPTLTPTVTSTPTATPIPIPFDVPAQEETMTVNGSNGTPAPQIQGQIVYEGKVIKRINSAKPLVVVTLDDGLVPEAADRILDVLNVYDVKATFFLIGNAAQNQLGAQRMRRLAQAGHEIGYHSTAHVEEGTLRLWDQYRWINDYDTWTGIMRDLLGKELYDKAVKPYARPPYGMFNLDFLALCKARGLMPVGWSCTPACYKGKDVALTSGDIFLLHISDPGLEDLMRLLLQHYTFVSLGQVLEKLQ